MLENKIKAVDYDMCGGLKFLPEICDFIEGKQSPESFYFKIRNSYSNLDVFFNSLGIGIMHGLGTLEENLKPTKGFEKVFKIYDSTEFYEDPDNPSSKEGTGSNYSDVLFEKDTGMLPEEALAKFKEFMCKKAKGKFIRITHFKIKKGAEPYIKNLEIDFDVYGDTVNPKKLSKIDICDHHIPVLVQIRHDYDEAYEKKRVKFIEKADQKKLEKLQRKHFAKRPESIRVAAFYDRRNALVYVVDQTGIISATCFSKVVRISSMLEYGREQKY